MPKIDTCSPLISDAYRVFVLDMRSRRLAPTTLETYRHTLTPFIEWLAAQGVENLAQIEANHIRSYFVDRQESGAAPGYLRGIARSVRAFCNFCVAEELIAVSPMRRVRMPQMPREILPAFTDQDVRTLLRATNSLRTRAMVLTLLDTGLRASELVSLNGGDIDLARGEIRVIAGKGDKDRVVYIGGKTGKAILYYYMRRGEPARNGPVFTSENGGQRLTRNGLGQILRKLGRSAGVEHCHPHTFRRTFAIQSLRNGMNIYVLARLMGHTDIGILRHYLALVEHDLADAHQRYGVVDNL